MAHRLHGTRVNDVSESNLCVFYMSHNRWYSKRGRARHFACTVPYARVSSANKPFVLRATWTPNSVQSRSRNVLIARAYCNSLSHGAFPYLVETHRTTLVYSSSSRFPYPSSMNIPRRILNYTVICSYARTELIMRAQKYGASANGSGSCI